MSENKDSIINQVNIRAMRVGNFAHKTLLPHPDNNYHPHWLKWGVVAFLVLLLALWKAYTLRLLGVDMNFSQEAVARTLSWSFYIVTLLALLNILVYPGRQQKEAIWASLTLVFLTFIFMIF